MSLPSISVRGLCKRYSQEAAAHWTLAGKLKSLFGRRPPATAGADPNTSREFWALRDVSFDVPQGQVLGIIGRNGAGKSTLLRILSRMAYPTQGEARLRGRVTSLLEVGTGFNPEMSGRENIFFNAALHGLSRKETEGICEAIIDFSEVRDFIDMPVKHYSSGMYMRLAFAVAAHLRADVLLLDEVLAVGDLSFQQKCLDRVGTMVSSGRTVLFVTHNLEALSRFCTRALWLDGGRIVQDGPTEEVAAAYIKTVLNVHSRREWHPAPPAGEPSPAAHVASATEVLPGNDLARLMSARIIDSRRQAITTSPIQEPVGVEVTYEVLRSGKNVQPGLFFDAAQGVRAFNVAYTDPEHMARVSEPGRYIMTAWLPGNLLNEGIVHVTICLCSPDPIERHCTVDRALSFHVFDRMDSTETARGLFTKVFPGVVRPKLTWETRIEADPSAPLPSHPPAISSNP